MDERLVQAVNRGWLKRKDIPIALAAPRLAFARLAKQICIKYKDKKDPVSENYFGEKNVEFIALPAYKGANTHVKKMIGYLEKHLSRDLAIACVHGSLGTYEEIAYSDFDALAVIKSEVLSDSERLAETMYHLFNAQRIMFDFDPLQHHGWFILTEADFDAFPEYYFPAVLFEHAKSLLDDAGQVRQIRFIEDKEKTLRSFHFTVTALRSWAECQKLPKNIYHLKSFLSQMLLLPSLYVHCRDEKAVFKKFSFDRAKIDFSAAEWSVLEEVSLIRKNWNEYFRSSPYSIFHRNLVLHTVVEKFWASKIPERLETLLSRGFLTKLEVLLQRMTEKVNIHFKSV